MAATLSALRTQVRENLGQSSDPSSGKWTNVEITQKINNRIRRLNRWFKVGTIDTSITTTSNTFEYNFPTDVVEIDKIELWDLSDSNNYENLGEILNWKTINDAGTWKILFPDELSADSDTPSRYTLKIFGKKRLTELSDDDDTFNGELEMEEWVVLGASADCLRDLLRSRVDMSRYMAQAERRAGNEIDISRAIREYQSEMNTLLSDFKTARAQRLSYEM